MSHSSMHREAQCADVNSIKERIWSRRTAWRHRRAAGIGLLSRALGVAFAAVIWIAPTAGAADDSSKHFDISAKPLAAALMEFGEQSGLTVVAPTTLTAGKKSSDLHGEFAPTEALDRLLKGSNLTYSPAANGTIAIEAINPGASAQASVAADPDQLSDVIVTAQKRSEALLQVAAPVTAVQASDLARQGDVRLADYAATVPGLNLISSEPGQTVVIIRGISTGFGAAIAATTATYIDDSPYGSSTANALGSFTTIDLDPATLQRVEVLRGPQGTLYGASAMGGLIKYVTIPPSLTEYSGRIEVDGSTVDGGGQGYGVRAMLTGPLISDTLGITLNAFNRLDPGYIDDPELNKKNVNGSRVEGGRLALLWQPTEQFSAQLSALVQDSATGGTSNVDVNADLTPIYGKYTQIRYGEENWDLDSTHYSLRANYDFGWAALTSITSYQTQSARWYTDFTNRFGPLLSSILDVPDLGVFDHVSVADHKITQEVRFASADSNTLEWLGGFFFTHERSVQPEQFQNPFSTVTGAITPVPGGIFTDPNHDSYTEYAGYADVTYHVTSNFKILGGLRFTSDSENNITPFSGILNGPASVALATTSSKTVTYLVSPSYNIDDHNMIYIRVATGFRPGGPTGLTTTSVYAGAPSTYGPDTLTNYELGYKASFPDERMTIDISGFDIQWKNIQVLSEIGGFLITGNGGDARSAGAELAWTWKPLTGLNVLANAAYTHAYLTADAPGISAVAGDKLPDVPEFSANVGLDYDFPITTDVKGFVGGNDQYMGSRVSDFVSGTPPGYERPIMPSYNTVNLHAGLSRGGLTLEAYIKNVGDTYGLTRIISEVQNGYGPPLAAAVIQPRTFGLSISEKF